MEKIATLQKWIDESQRIVFFGGAGVSTESGIPDFRSVDGLYNQKYDYPPETILSASFFFVSQSLVYIAKNAAAASQINCAPPNRAVIRQTIA